MPTIYAPKSGFIVEITLPDGSHVKAGDVVARIDDEDEQILKDKHRILLILHKQAEARVSAAMMAARKSAEDNRARANTAADVFRTVSSDSADQLQAIGLAVPADTYLPALAVLRTKNDIVKGELESAIAGDLICRSTKMLNLLKAALDEEGMLIDQKIQECAVTSPSVGIISILSYEGGFINAGDALAVVR
jgi:multidrug resistance efflux pump